MAPAALTEHECNEAEVGILHMERDVIPTLHGGPMSTLRVLLCCSIQVAEVQELRGTTSRQDAEVRHLRDENRDLAQKAALVEVLSADCASLKQQASIQGFWLHASGWRQISPERDRPEKL